MSLIDDSNEYQQQMFLVYDHIYGIEFLVDYLYWKKSANSKENICLFITAPAVIKLFRAQIN